MSEKEQRRKAKVASDDVLDSHGAAWFLGAHVETVRRLARRGGIPAYKVGKDWRFSKEALGRWCETHHHRQRTPVIHVVDDERSLRETVGLFLEADGYRVVRLEDGERAVEQARREMPDLVLLDLVMPGMSGVDVLRELHAMNPDLPVIVVTAYPDGELMAEALRYPPVMLLPKPVDRDVLLRTVRRVLDGSRRGE